MSINYKIHFLGIICFFYLTFYTILGNDIFRFPGLNITIAGIFHVLVGLLFLGSMYFSFRDVSDNVNFAKNILYLLFIFFFTFTYTIDKELTFRTFIDGLQYLSFFYAYQHTKSASDLKTIEKYFLIAFIFMIAVGFIQILFFNQFLLYPELFPSLEYFKGKDFFRLIGTFETWNHYALILTFLNVIFFSKYLNEKKISYLFWVLMGIICLLFTFTRIAYASILISFGILLIKHKRIKVLVSIIILLSLGFLILLPQISAGLENASTRETGLFRLYIYGSALASIYASVSNFLFGIGLGTSRLVTSQILGMGLFYSSTGEALGYALHNYYLLIMVETGLLGFLVWGTLNIKIFKNIKQIKDNSYLMVLFILILFTSFTDMGYSYLLLFFFILLGVHLKINSELNEESNEEAISYNCQLE